MNDRGELARFAVAQHRAGRWDEAERAYRQLLEQAPRDPDVRRNLAWLLFARGGCEQGVEEMRRAVEAAPHAAPLHNDLGLMLERLGRRDEAMRHFSEALRLDPSLWHARYNLGNAHQQQGNLAAAVDCYRAALGHAPDDADVHLNLGAALTGLGRLAEARGSLERALQLRGDFADAWINLGNVARAEGNQRAAIDCFRRALTIDPQSGLAYRNLGQTFRALNELEPAIRCFEQAVRASPADTAAQFGLATALEAGGNAALARERLQQALGAAAGDAMRIKRALTLPVIVESLEHIEATREQLARELADLAGRELHVADPVATIGTPDFPLAYHGRNETEFQSQIAALVRRVSPGLCFAAGHCTAGHRAADAPPAGGGRVRVGFVSAHLHDHTIGKLNAGVIQHLDRERFEVEVFRASSSASGLGGLIARHADYCAVLAPRLDAAQRQIADRALDVLIYPDIGLEPFTYYLAHARLAPVQCTTWGHPLTTGIPTIDYFISSVDLDEEAADAHYTEQLARLPHLANYYFRPAVGPSSKSRADFGLPEGVRLYGCLQSQFKLHPDDDAVFGELLARDPTARLVLLEGMFANWTELLRRRLRRSLGEAHQRVVFIEQQPPEDFSRLLATIDALVDPLHFGGGDTSYQSFAVGAPIVTLPSRFLRGRITYALYRALGIDDLIAGDRAQYVELALRLAQDRDWHAALSARILAAGERIFENPAGVRDLEDFLSRAVARTRPAP